MSDKLDFTTGIWWEEIGRATATSQSTLTVTFPHRKYIKIIGRAWATATNDIRVRANGYSTANQVYSYHQLAGGTMTNVTGMATIILGAASVTAGQHVHIFGEYMQLTSGGAVIGHGSVLWGGSSSNSRIYDFSSANIGADFTSVVVDCAPTTVSGDIVVLGHD